MVDRQYRGRTGGAGEPLYLEALRVQRATLGDEHPRTLTAMNNLAFLLQDQGKLAEAERLILTALHTGCTSLGSKHPTILTLASCL